MANSINYSLLPAFTDQTSQPIREQAVRKSTFFNKYCTIVQSPGLSVNLNWATNNIIATNDLCPDITAATGSFTLGTNTGTKCIITVNQAECPLETRNYWLSYLQKNSIREEDLSPRELMAVYVNLLMEKISIFVEDLYFRGAVSGTYSASLTNCNGLFYQLDSTSMTNSVIFATATGALTPSTAISVIDNMNTQMVTSIPDILDQNNIVLMSRSNFNILFTAYRNAGYFPNYFNKANDQPAGYNTWELIHPVYNNITIVGLNGFGTSNKIILTTDWNLVALFGDKTDSESLEVYYSKDFRKMRFFVQWMQGASLFFPQYIVYKQS